MVQSSGDDRGQPDRREKLTISHYPGVSQTAGVGRVTCPAKGQTVIVQPPTKTTGRKGDAPPLRSVKTKGERMMLTVVMDMDDMNSEDYIHYLLAIVKRGDGITPEEFYKIFGEGRPRNTYALNTFSSGISKMKSKYGVDIKVVDGRYCLIPLAPQPEPQAPVTSSSTEERTEALLRELVAILRTLLDRP